MGDENVKSTNCERTNETDNNNTEKISQSKQNTTCDDSTLCKNVIKDEDTTNDTFNNLLNTPATQTEKESESKNDHHVIDDESCENRFLSLKVGSDGKDNGSKKQQVHDSNEQKKDNSVDNTEDISELASNMENASQSGDESKNTSGVTKNINDAHLTFVDEDDGILKYLVGKGCSGDKKKLLDEDSESYSKRPVKTEDPNSSFNSIQTSNEAIGERLAHQSARIRSPTRSIANENKAISVKNKEKYKYVELEENETERKGTLYHKRTDAKSPVRRPMSPRNKVSQNASQATAQFPKKEHGFSVDDDCYDFTHHQRGYMVLVVNDRFNRQSPRDGAIWDLRKMKEVGRKFGFRELHYQMKDRNLTKPELMNVLLDVQRADHSDCDCLLLMISSHGLESANALKAGKTDHALVCADDQLIFTSTITEMFDESNCPSLKGKPKIFLIQACRGESVDQGGTIFVAHPRSEDRTCGVTSTAGNVHSKSESFDVSDTRHGDDSWATNQSKSHSREAHSSRMSPQFYVPNVSHPSSKQGFINVHGAVPKNWASSQTVQKIYTPTPYAIVDTPSLKCDNDMLVMYAIPPGMFAWRNTREGSWMIDYLHRVLMAYDLRKPKSFLNLLTQVNALMSRRATYTPSLPETDGKTAISVIEHKLCKDIVFQQKVPLSDWRR